MLSVDSFGWLERMLDGPTAAGYNRVIDAAAPAEIITSAATVYEVHRKLKPVKGEAAALEAAALLRATQLVAVDEQLAVEAAGYILALRLHFSDALLYATARHFDAALHTSDPNLRRLPGVVFP